MNDESVGRFPLNTSSTKTPKLYTSVFSVALPLCMYSTNKTVIVQYLEEEKKWLHCSDGQII